MAPRMVYHPLLLVHHVNEFNTHQIEDGEDYGCKTEPAAYFALNPPVGLLVYDLSQIS
jgi:hypothetical protein